MVNFSKKHVFKITYVEIISRKIQVQKRCDIYLNKNDKYKKINDIKENSNKIDQKDNKLN